MEKVQVIFQPGAHRILVPRGETLLRAAVLAGLAVEAPCAGRGTCGKCQVQATGDLSPLLETEKKVLLSHQLQKGTRLACLATVLGEVRVELPPGAVWGQAPKRSGRKTETGSGGWRWGQPYLRKVALSKSDLRNIPRPSQLGCLRTALAVRGHRIRGASSAALTGLAAALRGESDVLTAVLSGTELTAVEAGDTSVSSLGLALDIGTSTLVGYLMELNTGRQLAAQSLANPQCQHGQDLISRIQFAVAEPGGVEKMRAEVVAAINDIIDRLAREATVARRDIYYLTVVGNTCMLHLLQGLNPAGLAEAPYRAVTTEERELPAAALGVEINPQGQAYLLPGVGAFVGADTVGLILGTGLHRRHQLRLALDLGTNGELVLGNSERLLCCSAAAGPAFEGGQIRRGMIAAPGAIDRVVMDGDVAVSVIPGARPRGICGSALIDAVAEMLRHGVVDATGRLRRPEESSDLDPRLARRLRRDELGHHFVLVEGRETFDGQPIALYQEDIRQLQLAKAALRAGAELLKQELGVADSDIFEVFLAGAFGSYINKENAAAIGLLPAVPLERVRAVGNAAGLGAKAALCSARSRREALLISRRAVHIDLSQYPGFSERFMAAISFRHSLRDYTKEGH